MGAFPISVSATLRRPWVWAALVAFAVPVAFAIAARHVWEDYYITFRTSRNLVEGHGLVYQVGERVHTFTSPLNVLLPALGLAATGSEAGALWFFRIVSAVALAIAAILVVKHAHEQVWSHGAWALAILLGIVEAKIAAFSSDGMETGLMVLFAALTWREFTRPIGPRVPWLALGYAGLMWTRPDGFVFAAAASFSWWCFGPRRLNAERTWWRSLGFALLLGAIAYAPWLIWTWSYYGSPVPQTIIAKAALVPGGGLHLGRLLAAPMRCLLIDTALDGLFMPIYFHSTGWPLDLLNVGRLLARLAAFLWLLPTLPRATRAASLTVLFGGIYFHQITVYPWYYGPWTLVGAIALAGAASYGVPRTSSTVRSIGRIATAIVAVGAFILTGLQAYTMYQQQLIIEKGGRLQIGFWLHSHARAGDSVFLEPAGYIGYFSQLKVLDFPGLCAPEVSRLIRSGHRSYNELINTLRPTWLVLRPSEINEQLVSENGALKSYSVIRSWDQKPKLDACDFLPGRGWLEYDSQYVVFRRNADITRK